MFAKTTNIKKNKIVAKINKNCIPKSKNKVLIAISAVGAKKFNI